MKGIIYADEIELAQTRLNACSSEEINAIFDKFRVEQPIISDYGEALLRLGVSAGAIDSLLRALYDVYYVVRVLRGKWMPQIDVVAVKKYGDDLVQRFDAYFSKYGVMDHLAFPEELKYYESTAIFKRGSDAVFDAFAENDVITKRIDVLVFFQAMLKTMEMNLVELNDE